MWIASSTCWTLRWTGMPRSDGPCDDKINIENPKVSYYLHCHRTTSVIDVVFTTSVIDVVFVCRRPSHCSLILLRITSIVSIPVLRLISSFLILSLHVTPSVPGCQLWCAASAMYHISAPYCSVGRTSASYNRTYFVFNEEQCQRDLNDYASNDVGLLFDLTPYTIPDIWLL